MAHANVFIADAHTGSVFGLWPPDALTGEGGKHDLNPFQEYIYECWQHATTVWLPSVIGPLPRRIFLVGDLADGTNPRSQIISDDPMVQIDAAVMVCAPVCKGAERVEAVSGTEFHTGKWGFLDNAVADKLGAVKDETGKAARQRLFVEVDGVTLDIAHHVGGSFVPQSRATPLQREYISAALSSYEQDWPKAEWIIRGHAHWFRCLPQPGATVITLPGWTAAGPYVGKLTREAPHPIGLFVLITDGGKAVPDVKLYNWPAPKVQR